MVSEQLTRENLEGKTIVDLNQLCRDHEVKGVIGRPKGDMVNYMVAFNEGRPVEQVMAEQGQAPPETVQPTAEAEGGGGGGEGTEGWQDLSEVTEPEQEAAGEEVGEATSEPEAEATPEPHEGAPGPPAQEEASEPAQEESAEPGTVQSQSV